MRAGQPGKRVLMSRINEDDPGEREDKQPAWKAASVVVVVVVVMVM